MSLKNNKGPVVHGVLLVAMLLFWILAAIGCFSPYWNYVVLMMGFRFLIEILVLGKAASKLKDQRLILFIPILELFLVFLQLLIFRSSRTSSHSPWK